jgi:hypothetical protein
MADFSDAPEPVIGAQLPKSHWEAIMHYLNGLPGERGARHDLTHPSGIVAEISRQTGLPVPAS